jgi:hypothetical protein
MALNGFEWFKIVLNGFELFFNGFEWEPNAGARANIYHFPGGVTGAGGIRVGIGNAG